MIRLLILSGSSVDLLNEAAAPTGLEVSFVLSPEAGIRQLESEYFDAVLVHLPISGWCPHDFVARIRETKSDVRVVLYDPNGILTETSGLLTEGVSLRLDGRMPLRELLQAVQDTIGQPMPQQSRPTATSSESWRKLLVGESYAIQRIVETIRMVAARQSTVLITGETGTGKEVVARAIHCASPRAQLPMVAFNCAALPENLLEAELFGHTKGAFTGAAGPRAGHFEKAHRSTLLLDEIGDMPLAVQAKLLRVLQEREVLRLGSSEPTKVDVRVVAASNLHLPEAVDQKRFRSDLFYRLNVVPIYVAPLRERRGDIPLLAEHFIQKVCRRENLPPKRIPTDVLNRLTQADWPGNVRQLEHSIENAMVLSEGREVLRAQDFPILHTPGLPSAETLFDIPKGGIDYHSLMTCLERELLRRALDQAGGNRTRAAELLKMKRTTLLSKFKALETCA